MTVIYEQLKSGLPDSGMLQIDQFGCILLTKLHHNYVLNIHINRTMILSSSLRLLKL
jgi:hypothetical protein